MNKLKTGDLFAAMRVVKASGAKEALKPVLKGVDNRDVEDVGLDVILTIIECAAGKNAEEAIYDFLAAPFDMPADEVAELPINSLVENLKELAKENDLSGFFKQLSGLITSK